MHLKLNKLYKKTKMTCDKLIKSIGCVFVFCCACGEEVEHNSLLDKTDKINLEENLSYIVASYKNLSNFKKSVHTPASYPSRQIKNMQVNHYTKKLLNAGLLT